MTPAEDDIDALTDIITRLRAENARLREAGQAVVGWWDMTPSMSSAHDTIEALRAALKEGGGE